MDMASDPIELESSLEENFLYLQMQVSAIKESAIKEIC